MRGWGYLGKTLTHPIIFSGGNKIIPHGAVIHDVQLWNFLQEQNDMKDHILTLIFILQANTGPVSNWCSRCSG